MKKRILTALCCICLLSAGRAHAQWVVTDPGNLAQGIINAAKNIVHTSSTAGNMLNNFQETVKIYKQGKEYYDGLRKVKNLVRDARKVQQTILMVGDITEIYVTSYERMLSDPYFTPEELSAIALGYTKLLEESANLLTDLKTVVNENGLSRNVWTSSTVVIPTCCNTAVWCSTIPTRTSACRTCVPRNRMILTV